MHMPSELGKMRSRITYFEHTYHEIGVCSESNNPEEVLVRRTKIQEEHDDITISTSEKQFT